MAELDFSPPSVGGCAKSHLCRVPENSSRQDRLAKSSGIQPIYIPLYTAFSRIASYAVFRYPVFPLSVAGLIILTICLVVPAVTFRMDIKESVTERLRQN